MTDMCGLIDKKQIRKKRSRDITALDTNSAEKRLRAYHTETTILDVNDHCLLTILAYLNENDLCHVRNACTRFVSLSEGAFLSICKTRKNNFRAYCENSELRRIVCNFGHLFESCMFTSISDSVDLDSGLHFQYVNVDRNFNSGILQRLTHLTSLTLDDVNVDSEIIGVIHRAEHLNDLSLYCTYDSSCGNKSRNVSIQTKKSSLTYLQFDEQVPPLNTFIEFLQFNPKLLSLSLPSDIPSNYIRHIEKHSNQLVELYFFTRQNSKSISIRIQKLLSNLQNLKQVTFSGSGFNYSNRSAKPFVDAVKNAQNISRLRFDELTFNKSSIEIISTMKNVRRLELSGIFNCSETEFVSLVTSLSMLVSLTLSFEDSSHHHNRDVNFNTLKEIVTFGKRLKYLEMNSVKGIRISETDFGDLVQVLKERGEDEIRLTITIEGCRSTTSFDVPMPVQKSNENYLRIVYTTDIFCECRASCSDA